MTRTEEREAEMNVISELDETDPVKPLLLVCPKCGETEPHTRVRSGGPWLLICWGCSFAREE